MTVILYNANSYTGCANERHKRRKRQAEAAWVNVLYEVQCRFMVTFTRNFMQVMKKNWHHNQIFFSHWFRCIRLLHSVTAVFTALHGMQTRSYDENSVRPSVCPSVRLSVRPSVCQTRALWQNGRKLCLDFYIIWKNIYPSFLRRRTVGGGRPLLPEILG